MRSKHVMSVTENCDNNNCTKKLSYLRGTARRAVSVTIVLNVARMFVECM